MIVFDLKCAKGHPFEGWFTDSDAYSTQSEAGEVACPTCGETQIGKALMTPNVRTGKARPKKKEAAKKDDARAVATKGDYEKAASLLRAINTLREEVEKNCDYVGNKFAEEARKIHYGEVEHHNIYGEASNDEASSLEDEGVDFGILPWPERKDS